MQKEALSLPEAIRIGQSFKKKTTDRSGVGDCLSRWSSFIPGCPPEPSQITEYLKISKFTFHPAFDVLFWQAYSG